MKKLLARYSFHFIYQIKRHWSDAAEVTKTALHRITGSAFHSHYVIFTIIYLKKLFENHKITKLVVYVKL